jgi:spermidine/putrescine transport system permease protein
VASAELTEPKRRRRRKAAPTEESGVWYPRWYWPSFAAPGTIWLAIWFVLPFYVVLSLAFGTVDQAFRNPLPVYNPFWWQFDTFANTVQKFYSGAHIFLSPLIRTFTYVFSASLICLVVGYAVAYYTARYAGKQRGLILLLLVTPFWISYLMRIYAWQSLLQPDGYVNDIIGVFGVNPVEWLAGRPITVVLGLVYGYIPFMILPLFGSLDRINQNLLEAGRDLGASPAQTFLRVTLPLSRQAILAGIVIVTLPMFGDYYTNNLLSESPRTSMFGNLIDNSVGQAGQGPLAASLVLLLMVIVIVPMLYYLRETRRAAEAA